MKSITIIRHAQSKFNAGEFNTAEEIRNCKLTDYGKSQSKSLDQSFDIIILSPLKRAIETYTNSNLKSERVIISDLFREQKEDHPLNYLENETIAPESASDARARAREAVKFLKTLDYTNIGIISHGCFIWYFLEQAGQQPQSTYNTQTIQFQLG